MSDKTTEIARRSLEINQEIRKYVNEANADLERRVTELERQFHAVVGGAQSEPRFQPGKLGSRAGAGGAGVGGD